MGVSVVRRRGGVVIGIIKANNNRMGACCDHFLQKEEIHTNESRLRLLQHKVAPAYHTANDIHFTYFLHSFQQHHYLQRLLRSCKNTDPPEHSEDTNDISLQADKIAQEHRQIQDYLKQYEDAGSVLRVRMAEDERKIREEARGTEGCMVKLEIQSMEVVKGISSIKIVQESGGTGPHREEHLLINRARSQKIYREFVFPSPTGKIRLMTDPVPSAMTIDVEDIAKSEVICEVFTFKAQKEEFGFIALRLQFVSINKDYLAESHQKLMMLQKELQLCEQGRDGLERLSEYRSSRNSNSVRDTILSEPVSEYPNQYEA